MTTVTTLTLDDIEAIKQRQQATWASGDYAVIGTTPADRRRVAVRGGRRGRRIAGARRRRRQRQRLAGGGPPWRATSPRPTTSRNCSTGAGRAPRPTGCASTTQVADAEDLPFDDASFDAVLSTFGVMFTPNPERAAAELLRVCRPGGRIGLANWTPEGFVGQMFKIVGQHVPPPAGVPSPLQWGTEDRLHELFGDDAQGRDRPAATSPSASARPRSTSRRSRPTTARPCKAWAALDDDGQASFREQLVALADGRQPQHRPARWRCRRSTSRSS